MRKRNFWKFAIKGVNQEKVLNELSKKFNIFDYKRLDKTHSEFKTSYRFGRAIENYIQNKHFEILSIEKKGILNLFFNGVISFGLLAGFLIGGFFCFIQNLFVRRVEVWGNEKTSESEIVAVVKSKIGNGFKGNMNLKEIENEVYCSFSNLSFVSVVLVGQTIVVNLKEEIIPDEISGSFDPICSEYDGKITKINLVQGTLAVKNGEIVKKGQILVYPFVQNSNGSQMPVKPKATIEADLWIEGKMIHNSYYQINYRTGKQTTENEVYLGKLKIYQKKSENKFDQFEQETEVKALSNNNILPFTLKTKTYFETATRVVEENFESVKESVILKARQNALQKIDDCDIIKAEDFIIRQAGNISEVTYIITISKNIGG